MCDKIKIEIQTLIGIVSDLKVVTSYFIEYFEENGIPEESLYSIRLLENRLYEFSESLFLVYDGVPENLISPPSNSGSRLKKLFEKLVQESRHSLSQENLEKQQQRLNEDVAYQKMLAQMRKYYQNKSLAFDENSLKGNIFHQQQISAVLYQEIITQLRQSCEEELLAVIDRIIPL